MSSDYLDRLAAWAATTPLDALPPAVRERACLVIADSLGVTAHGMQTPEMREFVGFIKVHACGRYIHGALDCVETLMARRPLPPESIKAIRVRTYAMAASLGHADVRSEFGARFSLPFAVASLLCHAGSGLDNYDADSVADPRIQALARRVEVVEDRDFTRAFPERQATEVTVVLADGTELSEQTDYHPGEAEHPHPPDAVRRKFRDLAAPVWGRERAETLYDRVLDLERVPDVAALLEG